MSFTTEVKSEIAQNELKPCCQKAEPRLYPVNDQRSGHVVDDQDGKRGDGKTNP